MNIVEFLEARIAEDETLARRTIDGSSEQAGSNFNPNLQWVGKRVLAECAAKRAIIRVARSGYPNKVGWYEKKNILVALAAVYKDHPDYQQDWSDAT